jgi:hypothetical protein
MDRTELTMIRDLDSRSLKIYEMEMNRDQHSIFAAYLLWFFLGGLGIHKFYIGNRPMGWLYVGLTVGGSLLGVMFDEPEVPALTLFLWFCLWCWDMISLWWQVRNNQRKRRLELLKRLWMAQQAASKEGAAEG